MFFFFYKYTAPPEIYTLPPPAALPISPARLFQVPRLPPLRLLQRVCAGDHASRIRVLPTLLAGRRHLGHEASLRSEEHTSELQSRQYLVCRLLLEKKKPIPNSIVC